MERRGLTLIEVLAVVAILAVLMAMALPAVENRLEGARFEAAQRGVEAAAVMARAEAMRRGTMVELMAQDVGHGETGLFVEPVAGENAGVEGTAEFESGAPPMDAGETGTLLPASSGAGSGPARAVSAHTGPGDAVAPSLVIGSGVVLTPHAPAGASSAGGVRGAGLDGASEFPSTLSAEASDLRGERASAGLGPVLVARFMPDGSALAAGPVYLVGKRMAAAVSVNRWTGSAVVRVLDIQAAPGTGGAGTEIPAGADQAGARATSGDASGAPTGEPTRAPDEDSPPRGPGP
jgi:type IV fimbrial biogenesis protein FimT